MIEEYLNNNDIPYNAINKDAPFIKENGRKIYYNALLDDRAGLLQVYNELTRLYNEVIVPKKENHPVLAKELIGGHNGQDSHNI